MSLFPAYAGEKTLEDINAWNIESVKNDEWDMAIAGPLSPSTEGRLLQSDSEDDMSGRVPSPTRLPTPEPEPDFYVDRKMDRGNLSVSTLYYPGRPEYKSRSAHAALGATRVRRGVVTPRYFTAPVPPPDDAADVAARTAALQRHLADNPRDLRTWLHYIDLQEEYVDAGAALAAAEAAAARWPRCAALRAARCRLLLAASPPHQARAALRDLLDEESSASGRGHISRQMALLAARSGGGPELRTALQQKPDIDWLLVYAWYLSCAGLWERLCQLVELTTTLLFPPSPLFPPALQLSPEDEDRLEEYEDKVVHSGLPLSAVWWRVERARAAAHWRPAGGGAGGGGGAAADEERSPRESETAALLPTLPPSPHVLLALAQIPMFGLYSIEDELPPSPLQQLLPMLDAAWAVGGAESGAGGGAGSGAGSGATMQELLRTYVDPPSYLASDDYGFWSWTSNLFLACISHSAGAARQATAAHLLRWLRAVVVATEGATAAAARRLARQALRMEQAPVVAVEYSAMEAAAAIIRKEPLTQAVRAATAAVRAALCAARAQPSPAAAAQALYTARVAASVLARCAGAEGGGGAGAGVGTGAGAAGDARPWLLRAALRRSVDDALSAQDELDALALIKEKSEEIERQLVLECSDALDAEPAPAPLYWERALPADAEWGAARALLLPSSDARAANLHEQLSLGGPRALRYGATVARAVVPTASSAAVAALAHLYPHDPHLQLAAARTPAWRQWGGATGDATGGAWGAVRRSATRQLARALPHLLRGPDDAQALQRAHRALSRGPHTELCARVSLAALAVRPELAIDAAPLSKWVYVCAARTGGDAGALQALLLERGLRLRTLLEELRPVRAAPL